MMTPAAIAITSQLAREPLPVTGERQVAYLLLDVHAHQAEAVVTPVNLGMVLDRSGSMRGPRLQHLKLALAELISRLGPDDIFSLVTFDDRVDLVIPAQPVTESDTLKSIIDQIEDGGGTAMSLGLSLGLAELRRHDGPARASRMILVTDGVTRGDADQCLESASQAGDAGIPIAPVGMGAEWDDAFLDYLADLSGGPPSAYVRTPPEIGTQFMRQLQELRGLAARNVRLSAHFVAGVEPRHVTRVSPFMYPMDVAIADAEVNLRLGELDRETPHLVLIELLIEPKRGGTFRIAQVEASYQDGEGTLVSTRTDVVVTFSGSAARQPQIRPLVVHYVARANAARVVLRALEAPTTERPPIAPTVAPLFEGESREALDRLQAGAVLSPEERKSLLARVRELALGRRGP